MDLSKFKDIIDIEEDGVLVKIFSERNFTKAEKTEKKNAKISFYNSLKANLLLTFV